MKIASLCDNDTAVGLRLAGVKKLFIPDGNEKELWFKVSELDDIGILLITEKITEKLDRYLKDFRIRNNIPIIIEIPDKKGRITGHVDFVSHLIKKAVGIEVNK